MILGAPISLSQFLIWNLLPVTIGNLVAGAFFTGAALYLTYPNPPLHEVTPTSLPTAVQSEQSAFAGAASLNPM